MPDRATQNIHSAIDKLDSSMASMVEQDQEDLRALYGSVRLQIEHLEAKIDHLTPERPESFDDKSSSDLDPGYWKKIKRAEEWYQDKSGKDPQNLRKYMSKRLKAIYWLLNVKGIYKTVGKAGEDEFDVIEVDKEEA